MESRRTFLNGSMYIFITLYYLVVSCMEKNVAPFCVLFDFVTLVRVDFWEVGARGRDLV